MKVRPPVARNRGGVTHNSELGKFNHGYPLHKAEWFGGIVLTYIFVSTSLTDSSPEGSGLVVGFTIFHVSKMDCPCKCGEMGPLAREL